MRIVAGMYRGRRLQAPSGTLTRPTTDRVREALFSVLHSLSGGLDGAVVLDAFAGSGALGLEALSRGAAHVTFVEKDRRALDALRANIGSLAASGSCRVVAIDVTRSAPAPVAGPFSLILLDPPYKLDPAVVGGMLDALDRRGSVAPDVLVSWERSADGHADWPSSFAVRSVKTYGGTTIEFAVREGGGSS